METTAMMGMTLFRGKYKLQLNTGNQHTYMATNFNTFPNSTTTFYSDTKAYDRLFNISNDDIGDHCKKIDFSQQSGIKSLTVDFDGDDVGSWLCDIYANEDCSLPIVYELQQSMIALPDYAQTGKSMTCYF